jgi:hypothetical protein
MCVCVCVCVRDSSTIGRLLIGRAALNHSALALLQGSMAASGIDLLECQKRPTTVSKETYYSVKRDLLQCQKRPTRVSCVWLSCKGLWLPPVTEREGEKGRERGGWGGGV